MLYHHRPIQIAGDMENPSGDDSANTSGADHRNKLNSGGDDTLITARWNADQLRLYLH